MKIAENLKQRRETKALSQAELSRQSGVSQPMICEIEKGRKMPTVVVAKALADALHCSLDELIGA